LCLISSGSFSMFFVLTTVFIVTCCPSAIRFFIPLTVCVKPPGERVSASLSWSLCAWRLIRNEDMPKAEVFCENSF
jgi:hypothetical protein